jgi:hypothetical protein
MFDPLFVETQARYELVVSSQSPALHFASENG